jgi:uncharacterized tellurite resistance protein B-like protein
MAVTVATEVGLPTNPNCVLYGTLAVEALRGRPFTDLQRGCLRAAEVFHGKCGLPVSVHFGWRVVADRQNNQVQQVTAGFVIDGPAKAEDLRALDEAMQSGLVAWSSHSVERIPANAVPSLAAVRSQSYQLWTRDEGDLWAWRLVMYPDETIRVHRTKPASARPDAFLAQLVHAEGVLPPVASGEADLERMRVSWTLQMARRIVAADGSVDDREARFLDRVFPVDTLVALGLSSQEDQMRWYQYAAASLPGVLGHHDKLALLTLLFTVCYSDGTMQPSEMKVLADAGESIGLSKADVLEFLRRHC